MMQFGNERGAQPRQDGERRMGDDRRLGGDRRREIRFELDKDDRRSGRDRRHQDGWDAAPSR